MTDPVVPLTRNTNERRSEERGNIMFTKRKCEARDQGRRRTRQAAIYLRGPGEDEADLVKIPSIDVQREVCQRAAKHLYADVVREFIDTASPPSPDPGMNRLMVVIAESPLIDYLIVYSLDRLTPDCDEARKIRRLFRSARVILVAAAEDESPKASKQDPR
jgi:DNA invertase Pin-like site-specific DNA recombinase